MKKTDTQKVIEYMESLEHPLKAEIEALRIIIKASNEKLSERIKWNAPSFFYKKDMLAFHLRAKDSIMLVFIFYNGTMITDSFGLLEGDYKDRRMAKFYSLEDIENKKEALEKVINTWVEIIETI